MSAPADYMRTTLLADDDPRHDAVDYFIAPTPEDVILGIERLSAAGYRLDRAWLPYLVGDVERGGYVLRGNFADISAAFSVRVEDFPKAKAIWDRLVKVDTLVLRRKP